MYDYEALNTIKEALTAANESLAVAESVTSGHVQAAFSSAKLASQFYQGGITAYNLGQKARLLNIDPIKAQRSDCVSQEIAIKMAEEVCKLFAADWGIGITGYASPMPEQNIEQPFAFFAICRKGEIVASRKVFATQDETAKVQLYYVQVIIEALHDAAVLIHAPAKKDPVLQTQ